MTNYDKGREGVKNSENLADVICTCPQSYDHDHSVVKIDQVKGLDTSQVVN